MANGNLYHIILAEKKSILIPKNIITLLKKFGQIKASVEKKFISL